ncbi:hypothetical protein RclHR1_11460005 [Rhizophagus clarus]|nr:hypothetical protein RclHR1_11460005 [Rhizophagus clarus]
MSTFNAITADDMFAYYQQERPDNKTSQIYDALSKDLEEALDSNFFDEATTRVLRNIRDNWKTWKKRILKQVRSKQFQTNVTNYQKSIASVIDAEVDGWVEESRSEKKDGG